MKRNSTTLFLESPNAVTPVPWVNGGPNFSGFTDPTLSVLQQAWAEREGEPEVIPDPEVIEPEIRPDWQGFMDRLDRPQAKPGGTGLFDELLSINPLFALSSLERCLDFKNGLGSDSELRTLEFLYSLLLPGMNAGQIVTLNTAISDFNIPIQI